MDDKQIFLSTDLAHRLAAIDVGSNSVRLMVAEPLRGGNYRILDEEREPTRLGRSLSSTGNLDPESIELTLAALRRFKQIATGYQATELRTIATCAVREAKNGPELCRRAKEEIDLDVEVISSVQEARLAFYSVQRAFDLGGKNVVVADIGGGSTEIVLASGNVIESIASTALGTVRLTEMFVGGPNAAGDGLEKLIAHIDRVLKKHAKRAFFQPHLLIGSGGTFTSMAEMMMAARRQVGLPVRGYLLSRAEVSHMLDRLRKLPLKARRQVPGLVPDRADIIVAGIAIVDRLMRRYKVNLLQVHSRGVRDGLLLTMIDNTLGAPSTDPVNRDAAIDRFASACTGEHELAHGKHVAMLAGRLFDQMAQRCGLEADDRPFLEAAARLQDVGYLINYDQHHKHSYHLILNSRLAGFRPRELELIANLARYHRGSKPKNKHANFRQLSEEDQRRVEQLSGILRLAGGLDRSHSQQVKDVEVHFGQDADEGIGIRLKSEYEPDVDLWGARRRTKLFQRAFGARVHVEWESTLPGELRSTGTTYAASANGEAPGRDSKSSTTSTDHSVIDERVNGQDEPLRSEDAEPKKKSRKRPEGKKRTRKTAAAER